MASLYASNYAAAAAAAEQHPSQIFVVCGGQCLKHFNTAAFQVKVALAASQPASHPQAGQQASKQAS